MSLIRYFGRTFPQKNLYGQDVLSRTEVDHWLTFTLGPMACQGEFAEALGYLNSVLSGDKKYLVGDKISGADYAVFGALFAAGQWQGLIGKKGNAQILLSFIYILIKRSHHFTDIKHPFHLCKAITRTSFPMC